MSVTPSHLALKLAQRFPRLGAVLIRSWAKLTMLFGTRPHWVLLAMKSGLGVTLEHWLRLSSGEVLLVDPFDEIGREIRSEGVFEADTVALFRRLVKAGMTVLDVGANVGQYSVIASGLVGESGHVHAFEPSPTTFRRLVRNIAANHCGNIDAVECAVAATSGQATLHLGVSPGTNSLQRTIHSERETVDVRVTTLDEYASQMSLVRVDVIKIDVEGAELLVLKGAARTLDSFAPLLFLEFSVHVSAFGYTNLDLAQHLIRHHYQLFRIDESALVPYDPESSIDNSVYFNILAVNERSRDSVMNLAALSPVSHDGLSHRRA